MSTRRRTWPRCATCHSGRVPRRSSTQPAAWLPRTPETRRAWHNARDVHAREDRQNGVAAAPAREEQVRAAALRLFKEKGYHATSMRDIAAAVGINKGSLNSYIKSKEDLLVPVFEQAQGVLLTEIEHISADAGASPTDRLKRAIHAHVTAVADNLDVLTVYLSEWRQLKADSLATNRDQRERYGALFLQILDDGVRAGELRPLDTRVVLLGIIGMCNY